MPISGQTSYPALLNNLLDSAQTLQVVVVGDSPDYAMLVEDMLREGLGAPVEVRAHESIASARGDLLSWRRRYCVLLDLSLPDTSGLNGLEQDPGDRPRGADHRASAGRRASPPPCRWCTRARRTTS